MRALRPAVALLLGASVLLAGQADASPKSCNLIKDDAGDAGDPVGIGFSLAALNDPMKDIVGGDFQANTATMTAVIKLAKAPGLDPQSPGGFRIYLHYFPSSAPLGLFFKASADNTGALTYFVGHAEQTPTGVSYATNDEIPVKGKLVGTSVVMTVSTAAMKSLVKFRNGSKITGITANTYGVVSTPVQNQLIGGDESEEASPYAFGTPSCVTPLR